MNSFTTAPVAHVLTLLLDEAHATDGPLEERFAEVAADDTAFAEFLALEAKDDKGMNQQLASPVALVIAENAVEQSGEYLTYVRNLDNG